MSGSSVLFVVLLAMVAAFLALRLYSVLGKRTGHEQPMPKPADDRIPNPVQPRTIDMPPEVRESGPRVIEDGAERGVRALITAEPSFDAPQFLEGAKSAYRMILEAFWAGDRETIGWLTDGEAKTVLLGAIDEREAAGLSVEYRVVSIERAIIAHAEVSGGIAHVTVKIDSDISGVTRDGDGTVTAGSLTDAVETHDVWTFSRGLRSDDPNWKLTDSDGE